MKQSKLRALLAVFTLLAAGCRGGRSPGKDIAAVVDGKQITMAEIDERLQNRPAAEAGAPEDAETRKLQFLDQFINSQLLLSMAAKQQITVTDAEVEAKFNSFKSAYSEVAFNNLLKQQKMTPDSVKTDMRRDITIEKLFNKEATSKVKISDDEIRAFYDRHRPRFNLPEGFHVAHILVTKFEDPEIQNAKHDDAKTPEQAKAKVLKLVKEVQNGADFAAVARDYSEDPTSTAQGGDIGFQSIEALNNIDPRIGEIVQKMKKGETWFQAIETKFGYHLVKLLDKDPGGQKELSDPRVQTIIHRELTTRKDQALRAAVSDASRNGIQVTNYLAERMLAAASQESK